MDARTALVPEGRVILVRRFAVCERAAYIAEICVVDSGLSNRATSAIEPLKNAGAAVDVRVPVGRKPAPM